MMVLRMKLLVCLLACVVGLSSAAGPVNAEESAVPAIPSLSAAEFFELPVPERRAVLLKALKQRLRLFENISYETKSRTYTVHEDLTAFPYQGTIPDPVDERILRGESETRCRDGSFRENYRLTIPKSPEFKSGMSGRLVKAGDAAEGELRIANLVEVGNISSSGQIQHLAHDLHLEGVLTYWGRGTTDRHHMYFLQDAADALEPLTGAAPDPQARPPIESAMIGARETVSLAYRFEVPRQTRWTGVMVVNFDPARQFLPLAYRLERYDKQVENRQLQWFEAMRVVSAEQQQGIWFPKRFQLLRGRELPTAEAGGSVKEVEVASLSFGTVAAADLAYTFPAGVEVTNYTNGVRFTADGKGGTQGKVEGIPYLNQRFLERAIEPFFLKIIFPCVAISTFLLGWYMIRRQERIERRQPVSPGV